MSSVPVDLGCTFLALIIHSVLFLFVTDSVNLVILIAIDDVGHLLIDPVHRKSLSSHCLSPSPSFVHFYFLVLSLPSKHSLFPNFCIVWNIYCFCCQD